MEVPGLRGMAVEDLARGVLRMVYSLHLLAQQLRDENTNPSTGVNKDYIDGYCDP